MAPAEAVLAFASGIPLALVGILLLSLRPRRREAVFFGAFSLLWAVQIGLANLGRLLESARLHEVALLASSGFFVASWLFLAHFSTLVRPRRAGWIFTGAAWLVAVAAGATLALAPHRILAGVTGGDGPPVATVFGPLAFPLVQAPFYLAVYAAMAVLYAEYRLAPAGTRRHRVRGILMALALFAAYASVRQPFFFLQASVVRVQGWGAVAPALLFAGGALFLLGMVLHLALRPPPPEGRDRTLIAAFLIPAAAAGVEGVAGLGGIRLDGLGFWRFLAVAVLAHALARHQLFDLDLRLKPLVGPGLAGVALLTGGAVGLALVVGGAPPASALQPVAASGVAAGGVMAFRRPLQEALFPGVEDGAEYLRRRKLEVYRAALEEAMAAGRQDHDGLRTLRRDLDISPREHEVMAFMAAGRMAAPAARSDRVEPGARVADRYRIDRLLGEGGYGRAFLAYDERDQRAVVVKVVANVALGGAAATGLVREARILGELRHPHVIGVRDVLETPHETLLVLEYAQGGSLAGLLARKAPLPAEEAVRVLRGILEGLAAAHARGIVHRDVKPENVLLDAEGEVKLADFGIARVERPDATGITGGGAGTLLYMAPEQIRGRPADARSDLYAAAVVFHLCLTGRFYLRIAGKDDFQVRQLVLTGEPQLGLRDSPDWVEPFLFRGLAKDPAARFPTAHAMLAALDPPRRAAPALA